MTRSALHCCRAVALLLLSSTLLAQPSSRPLAPKFALATLDGHVYRLSDLRGKIVLLDFWATWCAPCLQAAPAIEYLQHRYADKGLVVLGVSLDEDLKKLESFAARKRPSIAIVTPSEAFNRDYGRVLNLKNGRIVAADKLINANLPSWILIDRTGHLYSVHKSSTEESALLTEVAHLADSNERPAT